MKQEKENPFLILLTVLCFVFASNRVYNVYYEDVPLISAGKCLEINHTGYKDNLLVIENGMGYSIVEVNKDEITTFTFSQLRDLKAKEAKCL